MRVSGVFFMLNGFCVLVRATCWVVGALCRVWRKVVLSEEKRVVSMHSYKHRDYMIAGGVCTAAFSLFSFVYFYHSKVGPLICSCGLCCTQEAASALFSRVSFTCAAPRREAHHLHSKHSFFLMQCCCLYGQIAHVSKGRQHTVAHFHLFCIVHVLLCICLNVICFTFALMCWL